MTQTEASSPARITWTAQAVANEYIRVFYRKKLTEEKWSTLYEDIATGTVDTEYALDAAGDYEILVRHENATTYSAWLHFELEIPELDDTLTLTDAAALWAARNRSRTDTLTFEDAMAVV